MASKPAYVFGSGQLSTIRYTPDGRRIKVKLPFSPRRSTTLYDSGDEKRQKLEELHSQLPSHWSIYTPETDEDNEEGDDPNFVGSESEELQSGEEEECDESNDEDGDIEEKELSDGDSEDWDDEISEYEVNALLLEAKELTVPCVNPPKKAWTDALPGTAIQDDEDVKEITQLSGVDKSDTADKQNNPPAAWNTDFEFPLPKSPPMNLSNDLLFNEVFKIQEIDQKYHICRGVDEEGAQCIDKVSNSNSFGIKSLQKSLANGDKIRESQGKALAVYSLCNTHKSQADNLAREWIRLAQLTKAAREYWIEKQKSLVVDLAALPKLYAEFAAAEVRRALARDRFLQEKEKTGFLAESEKVINSLRSKVTSLESQAIAPLDGGPKAEDLGESSALKQQIATLKLENSSLKEAQESAGVQFAKDRERDQRELSEAKNLHKESQETVEALRKDVDLVKSYIDRAEAKAISLADSLDSTHAALTKEESRSRELQIRLEERMALGSKTEALPETKLEKYLREELEKSQRQSVQQQKDFEKLRDEYVRLQIMNATLESQVKQTEAAKEELRCASEREIKGLAERNSDLSSHVKQVGATKEELSRGSEREIKELTERNTDLLSQLQNSRAQYEQLKDSLADMEKEGKGEASKSKFSLRDIYRRPKNEASRPSTTSSHQL